MLLLGDMLKFMEEERIRFCRCRSFTESIPRRADRSEISRGVVVVVTLEIRGLFLLDFWISTSFFKSYWLRCSISCCFTTYSHVDVSIITYQLSPKHEFVSSTQPNDSGLSLQD